MAGFFQEFDVPHQRVVLYTRVGGPGPDVRYFEDETILGETTDKMTDVSEKTGIATPAVGINYSVPYLPDAGDVYFAIQPEDAEVGTVLSVEAKAGEAPYSYQWYMDDKQVVNVPESGSTLKAGTAGKYFCVVTDAEGVQAVSKAAEVK